jgi:tight adherence protein C
VLDFVEMIMRPQLVVTVLAAVATFATVLTLTLPLLSRDRTQQRMRVMATERDKMRAARMADFAKDAGTARLRHVNKGFMQQIVDKLNLRSAFESEDIKNQLKMAGLRGQAPLVAYMFFRLAMPIIVLIVAFFYVFWVAKLAYPPMVKAGMAIGAGYLGFYLPNMFIQNLVQRRQQAIGQAFPDALDMLLICVQAGMSIEAAFGKVAKEVGSQSLELAEEFSLTTAELSYLPDRRQAFDNLGKRTGVVTIKAVATALIQAERYGTPISQALRVMAKESRDMRMSEAEKKAAALPPMLTVPMIIFFLPVLFIVILGPAALQVLKMT